MFDSTKILEVFLESFNFAGIPFQENGFDAMMVVEVEVLRPHDRGWSFMLQVQDLVDQVALVVVIDKPDYAQDFSLPLKLFMCRLMPDHRPQGVGAAGIGPLPDEIIDQFQNIRLDRNAEPPQRA